MKQPFVFSSRFLAVPPPLWFVVSAIFRYLDPAFAVLLFEQVNALGVTWFRITSAALIFALWTWPWQTFRSANKQTLLLFLLLGACLALMNSAFYLAIERLPLSLVATMEFVGTIAIATIIGVVVLRQIPTLVDICGIILVMLGVALHQSTERC